jgi:hypothetical protein
VKGTWQTTDSGSGIGPVVVLIAAAILIVAIAGPVAAAVAELVRLVLLAVAAVVGLAVVAAITALALRARRRRAYRAGRVPVPAPAPWQAVQSHTERPALPAPREVHIHLHGLPDAEAAEVIRRALDGGGD